MTQQALTAGRPHRPLTAPEQLRAIFAGELTADGGEIAALARGVLAERDEYAALCASRGSEILRLTELLNHAEATAWQWAESVSWRAPGTVIVPISLPTESGDVDGELVMDTAQAALLGEMLTDAARPRCPSALESQLQRITDAIVARHEDTARRARLRAAADATQDPAIEAPTGRDGGE